MPYRRKRIPSKLPPTSFRCRCGKVFHRQAKKCPRCGQKVPVGSSVAIVGALILSIPFFFVFASILTPSEVGQRNRDELTLQDHYRTAVSTIREQLEVPATAEFADLDAAAAGISPAENGYLDAYGYVEEEDTTTGAKLRQEWRLVWHPETCDIAHLTFGGRQNHHHPEAMAKAVSR